ncbi:MAG: 3-phosphoserine/phosphohydroxythreonine transaminase [Bacteroidota bacterium]|nr:3-phosphoserine/phosphohydroxythreonine transaminase [Bacteroidota bacterium]
MKKYNFYAGPGILPRSVIEKAADAVLNFDRMDLSLLEISHRTINFERVIHEAEALVKELLFLDDEYSVMFLSGGASSQFFMVPMNLLKEGETANYINTGVWSSGAIKEAKKLGPVDVIASSENEKFTYIPKDFEVNPEAAYLHITSNNTIYGSQYQSFPNVNIPLVCDMSSDIFSRKIDGKDFGLIYAGAQKNMGAAGVTLVVINKDLVGRSKRNLPSMLDYKQHIEKISMFNTPPVFPIYVSLLTMRWIKEMGGVDSMEERNNLKAATLYEEIDRNSLFKGTIAKEDRSKMNLVFVTERPEVEVLFVDECKRANIVGLAGHRSVGGFRASLYNALELDSVQYLVDVMKEFERKYA